ncbi:MAG: SoxR reducing system RseC family protein [Thiobacillaceae bacterium]
MSRDLLEQHAVVTRVEPGAAWVEAREPSGCGTCGGIGCSTRQLAEMFRPKAHDFRVEDPLGVKTGEMVWVGYPAGAVWHGALSAYGLPLVLVLLGGLLGQLQTGGDAGASLGAGLGLMLGMIGLVISGRKRASLPVILRRDGEQPVTFTPSSCH